MSSCKHRLGIPIKPFHRNKVCQSSAPIPTEGEVGPETEQPRREPLPNQNCLGPNHYMGVCASREETRRSKPCSVGTHEARPRYIPKGTSQIPYDIERVYDSHINSLLAGWPKREFYPSLRAWLGGPFGGDHDGLSFFVAHSHHLQPPTASVSQCPSPFPAAM